MPNWRKELRALTQRQLEVGEVDAWVDAVDLESDRGWALITGSTAENALEEIISAAMVPLGKPEHTELFGIGGLLASFSAKIKTAFAFGLIDAELRDQFDRVHRIRNAFAHAMTAISFDAPEIQRACIGLLQSKNLSEIDPRAVFSNTAWMLWGTSGLTQS
jgi:hypothetical protein